jgi:hypothetical protein
MKAKANWSRPFEQLGDASLGKRIRYHIGRHPILVGAALAGVLITPLYLNAEFNNGPRCKAIWDSGPQLHVWATALPPFRCMRQPRPIESLIPSDAVLETAILDGGPPQ